MLTLHQLMVVIVRERLFHFSFSLLPIKVLCMVTYMMKRKDLKDMQCILNYYVKEHMTSHGYSNRY